MYAEHPAFILPESSTEVMRYMSYAKFASLILEQSLYFSPLSSLEDKYEGTLPEPYAIGLSSFMDIDGLSDDQKKHHDHALQQFRIGMRDCTMICSWCLSDHESISMWDRYTHTDGLAILSDVESLKTSFVGSDDVYIGIVHYIDYQRELFVVEPESYFNAFLPCLHKRREYSDEKEIRALVSDLLMKPDTMRLTKQLVDLSLLIKGVVVSPEAGDWLISLIESDLGRIGVQAPVTRSSLKRNPVY